LPVEFTRMDEFAVITLNRPEALNALSFSVVEEIDAAITKATASDARALLITGAGDKAFCAGADINELRSLSPVEFRQQLRRGQSLLARLSELPIPSFAVVNGLALGGGMELALACTFPGGLTPGPHGLARNQTRRGAGLWRHPAPASPCWAG
jgi:enoyl-CoA hydratase